MRRTIVQSLTVTLLAALAAAPAAAQQPAAGARPAGPSAAMTPKVKEEKRGLFAKAKITPEAATATALASVPGSQMAKGELEEEGGKLIYSFDLKVPGQRGTKEVHVDANTGAIVAEEPAHPRRAGGSPAATKAPAMTKAPATTPAATKKP